MPKGEKNFHILTEVGSVLAVPLMYKAAYQSTNTFNKVFLYTMGTLMLIVDGYLLSKAGEWEDDDDPGNLGKSKRKHKSKSKDKDESEDECIDTIEWVEVE